MACSPVLQLLATTIQHEKPELEVRKTELLKQEEDLKIQLATLEDMLLEVGVTLVSYLIRYAPNSRFLQGQCRS